jgi:hypothetical protein
MYPVKHNSVFFALVAISFGHYGHHQASVIQQFKKADYIWCIQMSSCM